MSATLVWFRNDLRLSDHPALLEAAARGPILPVYVLDTAEEAGAWAPGGASRWWLHHSLAALRAALAARGLPLILQRGPAAEVLPTLMRAAGADRIVWNRRYEPWAVERQDTPLIARLRAMGLAWESYNAALLFEPWTLRTGAGDPYRVYTPFWKACRAHGVAAPAPTLGSAQAPATLPASDRLEDWSLLPTRPDWAGGLRAAWLEDDGIGEAAARRRLDRFLDAGLGRYASDRDRPDLEGTARLSPPLRFGEIGPRQIWQAVTDRLAAGDLVGRESQAETFLKELVWREFSYHLLGQAPGLPEAPLNPRFAAFPWAEDAEDRLAAWQRGRTGYPLVDAGMRQLWHTGWMHNRVRMVVASFLVKHLRVPWQRGEAWFWDTLVDADLASNAASWQWVAGCGADAAPFFRVFNPVVQGQKFDPDGAYVRRWLPELAGLPDRHLHAPWQAPPLERAAAGVRLGDSYPHPMVDHAAARQAALDAWETIRA